MPGILYVVATPIGNLEDLSRRAERILNEADLLACEDTRVTAKLLKSFKISKRTLSIHEHSGDRQIENILKEIKNGRNVAYVSDAGTPGVNDPGGKLVAMAHKQGIKTVPIPGPSALTSAISICGFPMDEFLYLGFAPHKKGRETFFKQVSANESSAIFFESTHRIEKALASLTAVLEPERLVCICRELTKMHETIYRGVISDVVANLLNDNIKGEFAIVIAPKKFHD